MNDAQYHLAQQILMFNFAGRFDASALHIAHALKQTEIQKSYNKSREKPIEEYLVSFFRLVEISKPLKRVNKSREEAGNKYQRNVRKIRIQNERTIGWN